MKTAPKLVASKPKRTTRAKSSRRETLAQPTKSKVALSNASLTRKLARIYSDTKPQVEANRDTLASLSKEFDLLLSVFFDLYEENERNSRLVQALLAQGSTFSATNPRASLGACSYFPSSNQGVVRTVKTGILPPLTLGARTK